MKKYKTILAPSFIQMLKYGLYRNRCYSDTYANKIEKEIQNAISMLEIFPYSTPIVRFRGRIGDYRKYVIKHRFLLIYKIEASTIYMLYFIDGRKAPNNYFTINLE